MLTATSKSYGMILDSFNNIGKFQLTGFKNKQLSVYVINCHKKNLME